MFAAIAVFKGQQDETEFTQAVQDINSKIINYANQVNAGTFPDSQDYTCDGSGTRPALALASGDLGARQGCIFLGRAIQFTYNSGNVNVYTILGKQTDSSGDPVTNIANASPEPSIRNDGIPPCTPVKQTCWVLTDSFDMDSTAKTTSAVAVDLSGVSHPDWHMSGIYTALDQSGGSSTGTLRQVLWGYQLTGTSPPLGAGVLGCIENTGQVPPPCTNSQIAQWNVCIQNQSGSHSFLLSVQSGTTGVNTKLTDNGC